MRTTVDPFQTHYEVAPPLRSTWPTRIDFSRSLMRFSHVLSSPESRAVSDLGGTVTFGENGGARFVKDEPLSAPKPGARQWSTGRFQCVADQGVHGASIECVGPSGRHYKSFYTATRGIEWFDYFCDSAVTELCRYELAAPAGLFSSELVDAVEAGR
jgi:hypothetical protein